MPADAFIMVCRPARTDPTHVAALISFLKGVCSFCYRVCCKQTHVLIFCRKARTVWTNLALCCPGLWRKKRFDLTSKKLRFCRRWHRIADLIHFLFSRFYLLVFSWPVLLLLLFHNRHCYTELICIFLIFLFSQVFIVCQFVKVWYPCCACRIRSERNTPRQCTTYHCDY